MMQINKVLGEVYCYNFPVDDPINKLKAIFLFWGSARVAGMNIWKKLRNIFWALPVITMISISTATAETDWIRLSATAIKQGGFIKITLEELGNAVVRVSFLGADKELPLKENRFYGLVAASYYTPPGEHPLTVTVIRDDQSIIKEYPIKVIKGQFPEEHIRVPEKTRRAILTPEKRDSDNRAAGAARRETAAQVLPPLWMAPFQWPLKGRVTTAFGFARYVNEIGNGRHSGIDIAAPKGTPVAACNRGKVVLAGNLYLTGLTVIVHHGLDLFTSYCHLSGMAVKEGDWVEQGQVLGQVGATGLATGPHLHLTFRIGEVCVDPYLFLGREVGWAY